MKRLFGFLIPICILSFIAFGISCAILGRNYYGEGTSNVSFDSGERFIFGELVTSNSDWEIVNEFRNININGAGATTIIKQHSGDRILVNAEVPDGREVFVGATYDESMSELTIEVRPKNITFSDIAEDFGKVLWSDDVFKYPEGVTVTISFPQTIYDDLYIRLGSGKMYVDELYAGFTTVDIGSGTFEMQRSEDYEGNSFTLDLGSGKAKVKNMRASNYRIDVGSGKFDITGLSRTGAVDMGSGSGTLVLGKECENLDVDIGSGALDIYVEETGANIETDIGSGTVKINAYGPEFHLGKDYGEESTTVGNGTAAINIEMGSGKVNILEAANAPALEFSIAKCENSEVASSSRSIYSSGDTQVTVTGETSVISGVVIENTSAPDVSSAPAAPSAPETTTSVSEEAA